MSLFPAFIHARKRRGDSAPQTDAATDSRDVSVDEDIFNLLPPESSESPKQEPKQEPKPPGRNRHPVDMTDLTRLSIDNDGRLYWDGKPVEVHRRILLSRTQVVGASIVAAFVVIGAIGAALQGSLAARDWACRAGWATDYCSLPSAPPPRPDIPA